MSAPTGSGKSTQVPQILLDGGLAGADREIVVLQPRRLAARMLAQRVASERKVPLGEEVGYQIRFENRTSQSTRIRYVTEAILLRQMVNDPKLSKIAIILFDEFHERHLYGDITLSRAVQIQRHLRPDLKLAVMSATLDAGPLMDFLAPATRIESRGRTFPVSIEYWKKSVGPQSTPVWEAAAEAFTDWFLSGGAGDVLIFMPGNFEIGKTIQALQSCREAKDYLVLPLHGELPPEQQDNAVANQNHPKIVVSTNVAETSLTIDGIKLVIDSGLARIAHYDSNRGINTLHIHRISQASADQRTGRAGRTSAGHCIRLWSEKDHSHRPVQEKPEVHRLELSETILTLKCSGVDNLEDFPWFDMPDKNSLHQAVTLLYDLGAIDKRGAVTETGRKMQAFPTHPRYARLLLAAHDFGCVHQAALIAALTQGREILINTNDKNILSNREDILGTNQCSDFLIMMRAWKYASSKNFNTDACRRLGIHAATSRQVQPLFQQFLSIAENQGLDTSPKPLVDENLQRCLLIAFSDRIARRLDKGTLRCELVHGRRGDLARQSVVDHASILVIAEIQEIEGRDKQVQTILTSATAIEEDWLIQHFPNDYSEKQDVRLDAETKRVVARKAIFFRDLMIRTGSPTEPTAEAAAEILAREALKGTNVFKKWDANVEAWIRRVNSLSQNCPELEIPTIDDLAREAIITQACLGAFSMKEIREREILPHVKQWLNGTQTHLVEKFAPEKIVLSNGKKVRVEYRDAGDPMISARIQDLLGVTQIPSIYMDRQKLQIQILAPNFRPVQITCDILGFWKEQYPARKKELQRQYPKHAWPDNPLAAPIPRQK